MGCYWPSRRTNLLQEFQFLKESTDAFDDDDARVQRLHDHVGLGEQLDFKLITSDTPNPFHAHGASENGVDESVCDLPLYRVKYNPDLPPSLD